jgi:hypothetical protein
MQKAEKRNRKAEMRWEGAGWKGVGWKGGALAPP